MTFLAALKESILEMLIGSSHLEYWRAVEKQRKECEHIAQEQHEKYRRSVR